MQVFCDEYHPGEWWSTYWAFVWRDIVLDGSLCRGIRIEAEDVAEESKSAFADLGADGRFFCDGVKFFIFYYFWVFHI